MFTSDSARPAKILANAGVRYCLVGDFAVLGLGYPVVPFTVQVAVNNEELETARSALASNGFNEVLQMYTGHANKNATKETKEGWPGYEFVPDDAGQYPTTTMIMPASYWHFSLSPRLFEEIPLWYWTLHIGSHDGRTISEVRSTVVLIVITI